MSNDENWAYELPDSPYKLAERMKNAQLQARMFLAANERPPQSRSKSRDEYIVCAYLDGADYKAIIEHVKQHPGWDNIATPGGIWRVIERQFEKAGLTPPKRKS